MSPTETAAFVSRGNNGILLVCDDDYVYLPFEELKTAFFPPLMLREEKNIQEQKMKNNIMPL